MKNRIRCASFLSCASASALVLMVAAPGMAQPLDPVNTTHYQLNVETVAEGLEHPWAIAFLDDGRYLVTERNSGRLRIGTVDGELSDPVEGVPEVFHYEGDTPRSQAGLFDVKLHPDFADNGYVYLSYSKPTERGAAAAIERGRLVEENGVARLEDVETVFEIKPEDQDSTGVHFGGRMAFDPEDGSIYLTVGDRHSMSRAQDAEDQAGSVLRMTGEGEPHADAPFMTEEEDADEYIFSLGHRNPQSIGFHPETGDLWVVDHGPLGGDNVKLVQAGENHGWPFITGGMDYSGAPIGEGTESEGMVSPVHIFEETVAPSGLAFVSGDAFEAWNGDMIVGGLVSEGIVRLSIADGAVTDEEWIEIGRRIRDVAVHEDGSIWLVTEHEDGEVLRLTPGED